MNGPQIYIALSLSSLLASLILAVFYRRKISLVVKAYFRFLFQRWRLITFLISGTFVTVAGPYTVDPTWDHFIGFLMSILCYINAPWTIAIFYRVIKYKKFSPWPLIAIITTLASTT